MKVIKKIIYVTLITVLSIMIYSSTVNAAKVKVTTETLYLREEASTSATILTMIGEDEECELLGEEGNWYKVKYKSYTGYISKDYATKKGEKKNTSSDNKENDTKSSDNNSDKTSTTKKDEVKDVDKSTNNNLDTETVQTVGSAIISKSTKAKILPLIQSSEIAALNEGETVTVISEMNNWTYIQTNQISGWVRSSVISKNTTTTTTTTTDTKKTESTDTKTETNKKEETSTEKIMYTNDSNVNIREKASTNSDIIMAVDVNTKLTVIGEEGDWYKVRTSAGDAYVSKKYVSSEKKTTGRGKVVRGATENLSNEDMKELTKKITTATSSKNTKTTKTVKTTKASSISKGKKIVAYAKKFLGVPYVYGGASSKGFDCSGFTMYVYKHFGISLPHGAEKQSHYGAVVKADKSSSASLKKNLKPGDIVLFLDYSTMDEIGHCGIYIGEGKFIHASSGSGYCVKTNSLLPGDYYNTRYCGARRII